jgi:two-component system, NarL family, sensor histidine kinase UhpB
LPEAVTTAAYYVLLEALTNVRKHAAASSVNISLFCTGQQLCLTVEDDGSGFDMASASLSDLVRSHHFGLAGMYEWARLVNGEIAVQPRLAGGTVVRFVAPIGHDNNVVRAQRNRHTV